MKGVLLFRLWLTYCALCPCLLDAIVELHAMDEKTLNDFLIWKWRCILWNKRSFCSWFQVLKWIRLIRLGTCTQDNQYIKCRLNLDLSTKLVKSINSNIKLISCSFFMCAMKNKLWTNHMIAQYYIFVVVLTNYRTNLTMSLKYIVTYIYVCTYWCVPCEYIIGVDVMGDKTN